MTFHLKENIAFGRICSIAIGISFLIFLGLFIRSYGELILYGIFTVIPEIWLLISSKKETVIDVINKTITVTDVYKYKKNKSVSFSYDEIMMISVIKKKSGICYSISLKSGTNVKLACANDKKLDNYMDDLITTLRVNDPQFDAAFRKQIAENKERQKQTYMYILKICFYCLLSGLLLGFIGYLANVFSTLGNAVATGFFMGIPIFLITAAFMRPINKRK